MPPAELREHGTTPLPCRHCDGTGQHWTSRHGGNDPDVYVDGDCQYCWGTGEQSCQYCNKGHVAVARWICDGRDEYLCQACHEEWLSEEETDNAQ